LVGFQHLIIRFSIGSTCLVLRSVSEGLISHSVSLVGHCSTCILSINRQIGSINSMGIELY